MKNEEQRRGEMIISKKETKAMKIEKAIEKIRNGEKVIYLGFRHGGAPETVWSASSWDDNWHEIKTFYFFYNQTIYAVPVVYDLWSKTPDYRKWLRTEKEWCAFNKKVVDGYGKEYWGRIYIFDAREVEVSDFGKPEQYYYMGYVRDKLSLKQIKEFVWRFFYRSFECSEGCFMEDWREAEELLSAAVILKPDAVTSR